MRTYSKQMCSQARCLVLLHGQVRGNRLAVPRALRVRPTTVDLQVRVRRLAIQYLTWCLRHGRVNDLGVLLLLLLLLHLRHMRMRIWRGQVRLAFLKMFNLTRRVLRTNEAAVQTANFVAFGGCVLVLEFGLRSSAHVAFILGVTPTYECSPYVGVGVSAHGEGLLLP
jgi:hypothetical protein